MRKDPNLFRVLALDRDEERRTGCCIRDDSSGCVQTIPEKCSVSDSQNLSLIQIDVQSRLS